MGGGERERVAGRGRRKVEINPVDYGYYGQGFEGARARGPNAPAIYKIYGGRLQIFSFRKGLPELPKVAKAGSFMI